MYNISYMQKYLHEHIPLSHAMGVEVLEASDNRVKLGAPLEPNINHRETIFGGSASALAILSAWCLVHFRLHNADFNCRVVIQKNTMSYDKPISGNFEAICRLANNDHWEKFIKILQRRGKSRIVLESVLECSQTVVGKFEGSFVALSI